MPEARQDITSFNTNARWQERARVLLALPSVGTHPGLEGDLRARFKQADDFVPGTSSDGLFE